MNTGIDISLLITKITKLHPEFIQPVGNCTPCTHAQIFNFAGEQGRLLKIRGINHSDSAEIASELLANTS